MVPSGTEAARAFIPAKNFDSSKVFYEALGFKKLLDSDAAIFRVGASAFILQRYYKKDGGPKTHDASRTEGFHALV